MTKSKASTSYFRHIAWRVEDFSWGKSPSLTSEEREAIAQSLSQFQLGEGSDGFGLLRRARNYERLKGVEGRGSCMERFILEEQRHSAVLGRFLSGFSKMRRCPSLTFGSLPSVNSEQSSGGL